MKNLLKFLGIVVFVFLVSCENEIDLNAEYKDTTVIFGLLNPNADTQFVRITKTFLEDGKSAIDLAKEPGRINYENLDVTLRHVKSGHVWTMKKANYPKDGGIFSSSENPIYYIDTNLVVGHEYELKVVQPDGKTTTAKTTALKTVYLSKPETKSGRPVSFINNGNQLQQFDFQFNIDKSIAKFEARLYFLYDEVVSPTVRVRKRVEMPIGTYTNSNLENLDDIEIFFPGNRFYETIASKVPQTSLIEKEVPIDTNLIVEIYASDVTFNFYQNLNGPIDGLAQVRPEYTNVTNGIGIFASRSSILFYTKLEQFSLNELISGNITGLTGNHNFTIQ